MKTLQISTEIIIYSNREELTIELLDLLNKAEQTAKNAYTPYSHFKVGAAILLNNGVVITGNNQENAAYPSGSCAERTAAFYASAQYPGVPFHCIAIATFNPTKPLTQPIVPCGACRQVLLEYEQKFNQPIELLLASEVGEIYHIKSISDLLPCSFHSGFLL